MLNHYESNRWEQKLLRLLLLEVATNKRVIIWCTIFWSKVANAIQLLLMDHYTHYKNYHRNQKNASDTTDFDAQNVN